MYHGDSSKAQEGDFETVDDIDFMADLQRVEEERAALAAENERLARQQVGTRSRVGLFVSTIANALLHMPLSTGACLRLPHTRDGILLVF